MKNIHLIYFSPASSTQKVARILGESLGTPFIEHDITQGIPEALVLDPDDKVIFAMPVYSGRIAYFATQLLARIRGSRTLAAIVCVYGNRDYDDALLELLHISEKNGFIVIAAAAIVARHSIFPEVAETRPDEQDRIKIDEFGKRCIIEFGKDHNSNLIPPLRIRGSRPYRAPGEIPFIPEGNRKCTKCGTCVNVCPVGAISAENPRETEKNLCISCTRCIVACPVNARKFRGLMYKLAYRKFKSKYAERKEPELYFRSEQNTQPTF